MAQSLVNQSVAIVNDVLAYVSGEKTLPMQQRLFNCAVMISIAMFALVAVLAVATAWFWVAVGALTYIAINGALYYLSRYKNQLSTALLLFSISAAVLLNAVWIVDRGAQGNASFYMIATLLIILFSAEKPFYYVFAASINLLLLAFITEPLQAMIDWQLPISTTGQYLAFLSATLYVAMLALFYQPKANNKSDDHFAEVLQHLKQESVQANHVADSLVQAGDILSSSALQQKTAIEQLLATTEELSATAEQNKQLAIESITALRRAETQINGSKDNADALLRFVAEIKQSGSEIQNINNVIDDIAWQTNLLSLNAMIEASRAGESNGGFRVVALEVKRLAEGAAEAADKINKLLAKNLQSIQKGVDAAAELQSDFDALINEIKPLSTAVRNMSDASIEQTQAILQINQGLTDIDKAVTQNQQAAEETAKTATELRKNAATLLTIVEADGVN